MNNDKAQVAFISVMIEIREQLTALTIYIDNHMEEHPDDIHWGHVGSARRVLESLADIRAFLNLK